MEPERAEEIGAIMSQLVTIINGIKLEELDEMLQDVAQEETMGPMLNPTQFQDPKVFKGLREFVAVLWALKDFKKKVSGIGHFDEVID